MNIEQAEQAYIEKCKTADAIYSDLCNATRRAATRCIFAKHRLKKVKELHTKYSLANAELEKAKENWLALQRH